MALLQLNTSNGQGSESSDAEGFSPVPALASWVINHHAGVQHQIADKLSEALVHSFSIMDPANLDANQTVWASSVVGQIRDAYAESQSAADEMFRELRQALVPDADPLPPFLPAGARVPALLPDTAPSIPVVSTGRGLFDTVTEQAVEPVEGTPFDAARAAAEMLVTGPGTVKRKMPAPMDEAVSAGIRASTGVAVRQALQGSHDVVLQHMAADSVCLGWRRVCEPNACYWCAVLASRGAVYKRGSWDKKNTEFLENKADISSSSLDGMARARTHDHCRCLLAPVFSTDGKYLFEDTEKKAADLWSEVLDTYPGLDNHGKILAFRRKWERGSFGTSAADQVIRKSADEALSKLSDALAGVDRETALKSLPLLEKNLALLRAIGRGDDDPAVKWHVAEIDRMRKALGL